MKPRDRLALLLFLVLALAAAALGPRVARRLEQGGALRLELGRVRPTALSARIRARFEGPGERVLATYYVSAPERMPAELRRMRLEVGDFLATLRARYPERFDFGVVDPEAEAGLTDFAARRRIAPFRVRSVTRDAWDERTVWSTLALAQGARPEALLEGLRPEHLPHLQELVAGWLDELEHPRAPVIALAAPEGFEELADALGERGTLTRVDLDSGADVPEADVLFWMRPRHASGAQLRALERLLASGTSVVLAGSPLEPHEEVREGTPFVAFRPVESALDELAAHFGLAVAPGLVLDTTCEELEFDAGKVAAPHWIRCIAPDQDFHRFAGQPNGTLLFRAACGLVPVPERLRALGWNAEVLATTTDGAWLEAAPPRAPVELATLVRDDARAVPKQALMAALRHDDPWHGELVVAAAETPFADGFFHREHVAHGRLLDVLLDETTSSARLVRAAVDLARPEPLPPLAASARIAWRVFGVGLPVVLVLALGLRRRSAELGRAFARGTRAALRPAGALALALAVALVLVGAARALDGRGGKLDMTAEGLNGLAHAARAIAARSGHLGTVNATLYLSRTAQLPPALRASAHELEARLAAFADAGARFDVRRVVPEELAGPERAALVARGVPAHSGASDDDGVTRVTRFTCALELAAGAREVVLDFPDARAFERLEFRLALALERLAGRPRPRVAFASDVPRLSAAEAHEQFQEKGLFAPRGTDVYALARASLARHDLEVVHVNPRAPVLPEGADVLVWLQPRRSIEPMLEETVRFLVGGGKVVLAAQHFNVRAQQFRGGGFEPKFWPQPQNPDLERLYFPELSIDLVREVLFDEASVPIAAESQLTGRRGARDFERQDSALPFQIRLSAAGYAPHALTRNLGDQAFLWANRIRWDAARLAELGLTATPLAFTSPRTWSYAWKGGWVPPELLAGPAALEGSSGTDFLGPQPLMVLFEGTFPRPVAPLELAPSSPPEEGDVAPERPWPASAPGKLLLIGDAEFLENERLAAPEFRGDQCLWNAVAGLALDGELGVLATRARTPPGFGLVAPERRLAWRAAVIASGPALLALLAAGCALVRRRAAPRGTAGGTR